ncbi:PEP-CTERM sorting domain-containing protein [Thalassotalea sp. PLHSN55]|uniref:PEP-CTERM sorting domain-containing protein n=1 Tax=Thalassotalea sp. PLHSN55 TaxID=3435888 RepID=UPI003F876B65
MKKTIFIMIALTMSLSARAGLITLEVSDNNVSLGDTLQVSVIGSGFDFFDTLSLDVEFDTSLFSIDNVDIFGDISPAHVGGDLIAINPFIFNLSAQSFGVALSFLDFIPFIGGDFVIATFDVTAVANGTSDFMLTNVLAADFITPVDATVSSQQVNVSVPEPATLGMLFLAAIVMFGLRKRA